MSKQKSSSRFRFTGAAMLLAGLLFLVPALNPVLADKASVLYLLAVLVPCVIFLCGTLLARMFSLDRMLVTLSLFISAAGIAALALSDPDVALTHSLRCSAGIGALLIGGIMIRTLSPSLLTSVCTAFLGLLLLAGRLITSTLTFPVIEAACALLLISFASLLARQGPVSASLTGAAAAALLLAGRSTPDAPLWGIVILRLQAFPRRCRLSGCPVRGSARFHRRARLGRASGRHCPAGHLLYLSPPGRTLRADLRRADRSALSAAGPARKRGRGFLPDPLPCGPCHGDQPAAGAARPGWNARLLWLPAAGRVGHPPADFFPA